jgi:hypothetical protein
MNEMSGCKERDWQQNGVLDLDVRNKLLQGLWLGQNSIPVISNDT